MKKTLITSKNFTRKHPLITGTFFLTGAGFLSRIIGFFYRIYVSRIFGEEGMGIYQLTHPVSGLAFSLTAAAFQTTISKYVAAQTCQAGSDGEYKSYRPMIMGALISIPLSVLIACILYINADLIAVHYLSEPRTEVLLQLLSFTIPFSAAHACINGYYYGIQKAIVPAWTQLLEQFFRVGTVMLLSAFFYTAEVTPGLSLMAFGIIVGEIAGFTASLLIILRKRFQELSPKITYAVSDITYKSLLSMVLPLSANRVCLSALQSIEAASLPSCLRTYGYDNTTALSMYGVLTGMAFPLIFFPNALTSSVSVLLLPVISENVALGKTKEVKKAIIQTIQYCSALGFFCMAFFLFFGRFIGTNIFHSELAGYFIGTLSFLCPFLYLNSTLSGILQGLGKANALFVCNVTALLLRLIIIFLLVPKVGMKGYLWGLLLSQIVQTFMYLSILFFRKNLHTKKNGSKLTK